MKTAREKAEITVEALAEMADVSERYIYRIKNEGKKPSYNVRYHLVRALNLSPDLLFYPEKSLQQPSSTPPLKSSHKAVFLFLFVYI